MSMLAKFREEVLVDESDKSSLSKKFLAALLKVEYEKHIDEFLNLKEDCELTDILPQKRSKSDQLIFDGEMYLQYCEDLVLPEEFRCDPIPQEQPAESAPLNEDFCTCIVQSMHFRWKKAGGHEIAETYCSE